MINIFIVFTVFYFAVIANCFVIYCIQKLISTACTCIIMYTKLEEYDPNYNSILHYQYIWINIKITLQTVDNRCPCEHCEETVCMQWSEGILCCFYWNQPFSLLNIFSFEECCTNLLELWLTRILPAAKQTKYCQFHPAKLSEFC